MVNLHQCVHIRHYPLSISRGLLFQRAVVAGIKHSMQGSGLAPELHPLAALAAGENRLTVAVLHQLLQKIHFQQYQQANDMPFDLSPAKDEDFLELMRVLWESFETPFNGFLRAVAPITNDDREGSLKRYAATELEEAKADPEIHWVKVIDSETGRIVG